MLGRLHPLHPLQRLYSLHMLRRHLLCGYLLRSVWHLHSRSLSLHLSLLLIKTLISRRHLLLLLLTLLLLLLLLLNRIESTHLLSLLRIYLMLIAWHLYLTL